jgi:hypothetical protein
MNITIAIVLCIAALLAVGMYVFLVAFRKDVSKQGTSQESPIGHGLPASCTETCDIYDKLGEPIRYDCGHDDAPEFHLDLYGEPCIHKKPGKGNALCSACLLAKIMPISRRCGACGFAIMPGDPVALRVDDERIGRPEWKTLYGDQLLVCLRYDCDNGPGYCGHWLGDSIKPAYPDGGNLISQVFKTGEPMLTEIGPLEASKPPNK